MKRLLFILLILIPNQNLFSQVYNPVVNYYTSGTPSYGAKIQTNIPFRHGLGMPTIIIEGYSYGTKTAIGLSITWYVYDGQFYSPKMSSFGGYTPEVKLAEESGKIVIFINDRQYFNRFTVRAYAKGQGETNSMFEGWTIVDAPLNGSNIKTVPYENRFAGNIYFPHGKWQEDGNVGIGTTTPSRTLDVKGGLRIQDADVPTWDLGFGANNDAVRFLSIDAINSVLASDPLELVFNRGSGVIIGRKDHADKYLIVNGNITAKEIKVTNQPGADFVFEEDYPLRPISELEDFVKTNKHLPEITPAKEMQANGVNQSEMNQKLLQKIEELTLYVIDLNKKVGELQEENKELKNK